MPRFGKYVRQKNTFYNSPKLICRLHINTSFSSSLRISGTQIHLFNSTTFSDMPPELPGFYFDPDKNRYFAIKGPIPGSSRKPPPSPQKPISNTTQRSSQLKKGLSKLLLYRELYGSLINVSGRKRNFEVEYKQKLVSTPKVWRYRDVQNDATRSLSLVNVNVQTPDGQYRTDALLTGGANGSLSFLDVGYVGEHLVYSVKISPDFIWPESSNEAEHCEMPKDIWIFGGATCLMPSTISGIIIPRKGPHNEDTDGPGVKRALITTLGSELSGGALYVLNLADSVDSSSSILSIGRSELASFNCTIWGADVNCSGSKAVVGTNLGATLVDLYTGASSTLCRSKSDVLSVQLIQSDNIALCGLRNGAIVTLDLRQPQRMMARHRITLPSRETLSRNRTKTSKPLFELRGNILPSYTIHMPSSICCLESLQTYDQYFLASSMDGSIRLYDHRLTNRGPVQSYEGHVNSHSHIKLAADASERFVMSGGEDCKMRIWNINSGELLFEEKLSSSVPLTSCWQRSGGFSKDIDEAAALKDSGYTQLRNWDAWVGTAEGVLRMQFPE